jgi:hypothetical protein
MIKTKIFSETNNSIEHTTIITRVTLRWLIPGTLLTQRHFLRSVNTAYIQKENDNLLKKQHSHYHYFRAKKKVCVLHILNECL